MRSESDISGKYFQIEKKKISRDTFVNFEHRQVLFLPLTLSFLLFLFSMFLGIIWSLIVEGLYWGFELLVFYCERNNAQILVVVTSRVNPSFRWIITRTGLNVWNWKFVKKLRKHRRLHTVRSNSQMAEKALDIKNTSHFSIIWCSFHCFKGFGHSLYAMKSAFCY